MGEEFKVEFVHNCPDGLDDIEQDNRSPCRPLSFESLSGIV